VPSSAFPYTKTKAEIWLTPQNTNLRQVPQWCQGYLNNPYNPASLPSLETQTINLVLRLIMALANDTQLLIRNNTPSSSDWQ